MLGMKYVDEKIEISVTDLSAVVTDNVDPTSLKQRQYKDHITSFSD